MKGIILAGGKGTRLYPLTKVLSKQILNIYDKPMIYYPLSILLIMDIREILIISTKEHLTFYSNLLGDGSNYNLKFEYIVQDEPRGLADALVLGKEFVNNSPFALILGDNFIFGNDLVRILNNSKSYVIQNENAVIFSNYVNNPSQFGIAEVGEDGKVISIEEKPNNPKSNLAIIGLYLFPAVATHYVNKVKPSKRGELEITSILNIFLKKNKLKCEEFGRGVTWLDTGTFEDLLEASNFVKIIRKTQGKNIGCIEEVLFFNKIIDKRTFKNLIDKMPSSEYKKYLDSIS